MSKQPTTPPADWEVKRLKDVADIRFSSVDKKSRPGEKPVRLCNYVDAYQNEYLTGREEFMEATATDAEIAQFGIQTGDIMVTKDSETPDDIGVPSVYLGESGRLVCGYHLALVRPDQNEVNPVFLAKQIRHHRLARYFGRVCNGLTRYGLPTSAFEDAEIWQPQRPEQDAVARVLQSIDEAIRQTAVVIEKLKQIKAGLLHDLLTRGIDENGQLRDPVRHPEQFKDSPLGRVPREWDIVELGSVALVQRGKFMYRPRNDPRLYGGPYPFVQTGDVAACQGGILKAWSQTLNEKGRSVSQEFPAGTIAVTIAANIGDTAILGRPMCFPDSVVGVQVQGDNSNTFIQLCIEQRKRWLADRAPQSAQKNINLETLKPLLVPLPRPEEQDRISEAWKQHGERLAREAALLRKLMLTRAGLASDLLNGKVRVPAVLIGDLADDAPEGKVVKLGANIHFKRAVLAAEVVEQMHGDITFGHVKLMKTLYLVERLAELELGGHYLRAAAGPFDNRLLRSVDAQLKKKEWFDKVPRTAGKGPGAAGEAPAGWRYVPLAKRGEHRAWFEKYWGGARARIQRVIDLLKPLDTQQCEILATLYEAWRALASAGKAAGDGAIVDEVLLRWHASKQAIPRERWLKALEWMRREGVIPKTAASRT